MKNKNVGFLVIGIAIVMAVMVGIFNLGLKKIVGETCTHGTTCSMFDTIAIQTWVSLAMVLLILIIGIFLIFSKQDEKIIVKTKRIKEKIKEKKIDLSELNDKEKEIVEILEKENAVFQRDFMERVEIGKVGMTRLLDKLEAKEIIERKRRGMNNIVVLKR